MSQIPNDSPYLLLSTPTGNKKFYLTDGLSWTLGRSEKNSFVITDQWISRNHAIIKKNEIGEYYLIDLGTRNGSFVNDQRVSIPIILFNGDQITLGQTRLEFYDPLNIAPSQENIKFQRESLTETDHLRRLISVLVADLRDFKQLSRQVDGSLLAKIIGSWFKESERILHDLGTIIDQYSGDSVIGVWLHQEEIITEDLLKIFQAAKELQLMTNHLTVQYSLPFSLSIGVGINTGYGLVGNVGSSEQPEYAALGDTVNAAYRLEAATKQLSLDLAIGEQTYLAIANLDNLKKHFYRYTVKLQPNETPILVYGAKFEILNQILNDNNSLTIITNMANQILSQILATGVTKLLHFKLQTPNHSLLDIAHQDIEINPQEITPEIKARLEFLLALDTQDQEEARLHFEESLRIWQYLQDLDHKACILYCLGLLWYGKSWQQLNKTEALTKAKEYLKQALEDFEKAERLDHVAKFIDGLGEILQQLKQWTELETLAQKALTLYQTHSDPLLLAQAYGFLAEVYLNKGEFNEAHQSSSTSLSLVGQPSQKNSAFAWKSSWFLCLLGLAKRGLGNTLEAIKTLETAKASLDPYSDPLLYIRILENLQQIYYQQQEYLKAFHLKQQQQTLEYQIGLRAFLGLGKLAAFPYINFPTLQFTIQNRSLPLGRQEEIKTLETYLKTENSQLTIIYGQSGVGKTYYLQLGLIPQLQENLIEPEISFKSTYSDTASSSREKPLVIYLETYHNWLEEFNQKLNQTLDQNNIPRIDYNAIEDHQALEQIIIDQLRHNNQLTLIIFDQFESFFNQQNDPKQVQNFAIFLNKCLATSQIKIIFALQEDYFHKLLELIRLTKLDNIFTQNNLFYLDNFSLIKAQTIIQELIKYSQLNIETELIVKFIQDLSTNTDQINLLQLQLLGYQLEEQQITNLSQYQEHKSLRGLWQDLLTDIMQNCGLENEPLAILTLSLLKSETGTSLIKNRRDLELDLNHLGYNYTQPQLDLVLTILTESKLLSIVSNGYQIFNQELLAIIPDQEINPQPTVKPETSDSQQILKQLENELKKYQQLTLVNSSSNPPILTRPRNNIYQLKTGNSFEGHYAGITAINFSSNGQFLATASLDKSLKLWNLTNQKLKTFLDHDSGILAISFDPNNLLIATASLDKTIKLWNLNGENLTTFTGHQGGVTSVAFIPALNQEKSELMIISGSLDKTIKLWNLNGENLTTFTGHQGGVTSIGIIPSLKSEKSELIIVSGSLDQTIKLWNLNGENLRTLTGHQGGINSIAVSYPIPIIKSSVNNQQSEIMIISGSSDKTIKLWNLDGENLKTLTGHQGGINTVTISSDGQMIASGSLDTTVKLWNLEGQILQTLRGHNARVDSISFSPNGQIIATASWDKTIKFWSLQREPIQIFSCHTDWVNGISFSPDSQIIATGSNDKTIKLWNLAGKPLKTFSGHQDWVTRICWSPDGTMIASTSWDKTVKIWDLEGNILHSLDHEDTVNSVKFSPDGQMLVSTSMDKTIKLWNIAGEMLLQFPDQDAGIMTANFSPDGQNIVTGSMDKLVILWDLNGQKLGEFPGHGAAVVEAIFSPDGQLIATASWDHTVKLWSLDGQEKHTFEHQETVNSVQFSPDGQTLATASLDHQVKLWDLDGKSIDSFQAEEIVNSLCFSPDGQILAACDRQGRVILQFLKIGV
jgi:WD40 repeat protein/class 3 adenylate cyclase